VSIGGRDKLKRHAPLPYTVTLRVSMGEDGPPTSVDKDVLAYSIEEAIWAAACETHGVLPKESQLTIEKVAPNMRRWFEMVAQGLIT